MFGKASTTSDQGLALSQHHLHCVLKPTYKPRRFKNKGAILTLFWSICGLSIFSFFIESKWVDNREYQVFVFSIVVFPIAGWLADVFFGRYKVIKIGMFAMWVASILYVIAVILKVHMALENYLFMFFTVTVGLLAFATFQANLIQFGVDQLNDASSYDISSYISWFAWAFFFGRVVINYSQKCICKAFTPISTFFGPLILTLCLCSDILFNGWLVKEPASFNPLKLIFKVLKYAVTNKYPRLRSAFAYWDGTCYSRIDLAKQKYGGPFTEEQVEDVKTFFRIMVIILLGCLFVGLVYVVNDTVNEKMLLHYQDHRYAYNCSSKDCFERISVREFNSLVMVAFIPVFEIILYPLLWKYMQQLGIMKKFILGMFVQLFYQLSLLVLEIVGHHLTSMDSSLPSNFSVTCMLEISSGDKLQDSVLSLDFKWIALVKIFDGFSIYCLFTATVEFVCAQSPYSMKGLLGGMIYTLLGLAILLSLGIRYPFKYFHQERFGNNFTFGCGVWYFLSVSVLTTILIIVACAITKWYSKRRRRDEDIHVEHEFAENYYQDCST